MKRIEIVTALVAARYSREKPGFVTYDQIVGSCAELADKIIANNQVYEDAVFKRKVSHMQEIKKPLRIPNRDKKGRFAAPPAFTPEQIARAMAEFQQKPKEDKK